MAVSSEQAETGRWAGFEELLAEGRWLYASRGQRIAIGLVIAAVALVGKAISEGLQFETAYLLLIPAVVGAGILGGFAGGAVATIVIAALLPLVDPPLVLGTNDTADVRRLALFLIDGLVLSALTDALRRTLVRIEDARRVAVDSRERTRLLQRLASELATESHQREIAETALGVSLGLVRSSRAGILVRGPDGLRVLAAIGYGAPGLAVLEEIAARAPVAATWVIDRGEELWLDDLRGMDARFLEVDESLLREADAVAVAGLPLRARGSTFGVLFYTWSSVHPLEEPEKALLRSLAALTAQALDRATLYEDQVERVSELARREAVREAFLAVLSHELRTPVTTIFSASSILARDQSGAAHPDLVLDIRDEAERLWRIVDDLLVVSRSERGLIEVAPEPLLLQRFLPDVIADVSRKHPAVTFEATIAPTLPAVMADSTALRQVLHNLLANAAKYAGTAGPIVVRATIEGSFVDVAVLDRGPGVGSDPEALFRLFYRSPHSSRGASGTGIGLYVARELVKAMGGAISAARRRGGGARFHFTLPVAVDDETTFEDADATPAVMASSTAPVTSA